jgi:hypothetical protein
MKAEEYRKRREEAAGWPVNVVSYRLGNRYYSQVDNVEPGAVIARSEAATRDEAERKALDDARRRLERTRVLKQE